MFEKKEEIKQYIKTQITSFIEPMVYDIVKKRPLKPQQHAIKWLTKYIKQRKNKDSDIDSQNEDKVQQLPFDYNKLQQKKSKGKSRSRIGISSEVFGQFNRRDILQIKRITKTQQVKLLVLSLIRNSILFQNIDYQDQNYLIDVMEEIVTQQNQTIIQEGQNGDALFIVQSGQYDCIKLINGQNKYLKTYKQGDAFGQLSLMYNAPRAATIKVKTPGKIYSLDRITFSSIVKSAVTKKRKIYKKVIESIDIFADFNEHQKQQLFDVLKQQKFQSNQYIIKQGQSGTKFYIVIEGKLVAQKKDQLSEFPKIVYKYQQSDYFGQLSLLHDINRQASVKAITRVRLASINRESFKRILGNLEDILKRNEQRYHTVQKKSILC